MSSLPIPEALEEQLDEVARVTEGCHSELQRLTWPVDPSLMETCAQASAPRRDSIERLLGRLEDLPSEGWSTQAATSTGKVPPVARPARAQHSRRRPQSRPAPSTSSLPAGSRQRTHWPRYALGGLVGAAAAVFLMLPWLGTDLPVSDIELGSPHQLSSAVPVRVGPSIELSGDGLIQLARYDADGVELELVAGRLHARVDPEGRTHELTVQAGDFSVEVQGTEFDVERLGAALSVDVQEGRVVVREGGQEDVVLGAGQSLRVDPAGNRSPDGSLAGAAAEDCEEDGSPASAGPAAAARPGAVAAVDSSSPETARGPAGAAASSPQASPGLASAPGPASTPAAGSAAPAAPAAASSGSPEMPPAAQASAPGARPTPSDRPEALGATQRPDSDPRGAASPAPGGDRGPSGGAGSEPLAQPYEPLRPFEDEGYGFCPAPPPGSKADRRSKRRSEPRAPVAPTAAAPATPLAPVAPVLPSIAAPESPSDPSKAAAPLPSSPASPSTGLPPALAAARAEVVAEPVTEKTRWPEGVLPPSAKEGLAPASVPERELSPEEEAWLNELEGGEDAADSSCAPAGS